jgi:hypothetical protein
MTRVTALPGLEAAGYARHALHAEGCNWLEKNCYIDIWIEALHALRVEPLAMLSFTLAVDFEGDQWTFFKPVHEELRALYGVDVQELTVWRPLLEHAQEHLPAGKLISSEADAFWLPDTAGTDYRQQHTKTTIVIADVDVDAQRMGYFHNAGYFELDGEDFRKLFRIGVEPDPAFMPLFAELIRFDRIVRRPSAELAAMSRELLLRHLARRPTSNPVRRFAERFARELPALQERGLAHYHAWAFATVRQLGAAFELAAEHLKWLQREGIAMPADAIGAFAAIAEGNKTLILKAARAVNARRAFDAGPMFEEMAAAWDTGMAALDAIQYPAP